MYSTSDKRVIYTSALIYPLQKNKQVWRKTRAWRGIVHYFLLWYNKGGKIHQNFSICKLEISNQSGAGESHEPEAVLNSWKSPFLHTLLILDVGILLGNLTSQQLWTTQKFEVHLQLRGDKRLSKKNSLPKVQFYTCSVWWNNDKSLSNPNRLVIKPDSTRGYNPTLQCPNLHHPYNQMGPWPSPQSFTYAQKQ